MFAWIGAGVAKLIGAVGVKWALALLTALGLSSGVAIGYLGGKVSGHFNCNERIALATEKARNAALQRDIEVAKSASKADKALAKKLEKDLEKARKLRDAIPDNGNCSLSRDDVKRLRNIR